jgi:hypothetical protein
MEHQEWNTVICGRKNNTKNIPFKNPEGTSVFHALNSD